MQIVLQSEVVKLDSAEANGSLFGFKLTSPLGEKSELSLYADTEAEMKEWIGAIRLAAQGGKKDVANVFAAVMKPKPKSSPKAPLSEEEAAIRLQEAVKKYCNSKKSQGKISAARKYRFEQQKRDKEAMEYNGIVSRPVRCYKKLNTESEYQERWVWLDLSNNKLYWAKKNPVEGGNDLPPVKPLSLPHNVVGTATTTTSGDANSSINEVPVVKISDEQIVTSGAKFLNVKGYVLACSCSDNVRITRSGKEIVCSKIEINLDPNNIPASVQGTGKIFLNSITSGVVHKVEIFVPNNDKSEGSAFFYADIMRKAIRLSKSS